MKIKFFTIALDAMPWITSHLPIFNSLTLDWQWFIVEGVARNVKDTAWCKAMPPRLSNDGTTSYLRAISKNNSRVIVEHRPLWNGKVDMVNACVGKITEPCIVMQIDADELWTGDQIVAIASLFQSAPAYNCARFYCRYFVGPNLVVHGRNCYGNKPGEWLRAWRWTPGMRFIKHEPPVVEGINAPWRLDDEQRNPERCFSREATAQLGLVFDHYAYALESQVAFKQDYYGYENAVESWRKLQDVREFPVKLRDYFPWVTDESSVNPLVDRSV